MLTNKRYRAILVAVAVMVLLVAIGIYFGSKSIGDESSSVSDRSGLLTFNKLDGILDGAPRWYENAYTLEYTVDELKNIIKVDISQCIPESLIDGWVSVSAQYINSHELQHINIGLLQQGHEPYFGKSILISVANKEWSEESFTSNDYSFNEAIHSKSYIDGVAVDAYTATLPDLFSGLPIFIAQFEIDGFEYYVEGKEGISESEFTELVVNIIHAYTNLESN